jgi:hypothetical protein
MQSDDRHGWAQITLSPMRHALSFALVLFLALSAGAQTAPDAAELTRLLNEFLAGASDPVVHERFWAEDLIYTGSSGRRIGKADILKGMRAAPAPKPSDPTTVFSGEDVRIQQYGDTAIVAFRLVGKTRHGDVTDVSNYLNSGTFLRRDGKWQVVNWQATRMPRPEEQDRKDVAAAEAALRKALLASDAATLDSLLDESFQSRKKLLDDARAGKLKSRKAATKDVTTISLYGDTALVRGAADTLTFVRKDGEWKVVAMHSTKN